MGHGRFVLVPKLLALGIVGVSTVSYVHTRALRFVVVLQQCCWKFNNSANGVLRDESKSMYIVYIVTKVNGERCIFITVIERRSYSTVATRRIFNNTEILVFAVETVVDER